MRGSRKWRQRKRRDLSWENDLCTFLGLCCDLWAPKYKLNVVEKQSKKLIQVPKSLFDKQNGMEVPPKCAGDLFVFLLLFRGTQMVPKRDRWDVKVTETWLLCSPCSLVEPVSFSVSSLPSSPSFKNIWKTVFSYCSDTLEVCYSPEAGNPEADSCFEQTFPSVLWCFVMAENVVTSPRKHTVLRPPVPLGASRHKIKMIVMDNFFNHTAPALIFFLFFVLSSTSLCWRLTAVTHHAQLNQPCSVMRCDWFSQLWCSTVRVTWSRKFQCPPPLSSKAEYKGKVKHLSNS